MNKYLKFSFVALMLLSGCNISLPPAQPGSPDQGKVVENPSLVLNDSISPGYQELGNARDSLPKSLNAGQCAVACYTKFNNSLYLIGYYQMPGNYVGNVCSPKGSSNEDISVQSSVYSQLCSERFKCPDSNKCWAGGDTGGFYRNF